MSIGTRQASKAYCSDKQEVLVLSSDDILHTIERLNGNTCGNTTDGWEQFHDQRDARS